MLKEYRFAEVVKARGWAIRVPNLDDTKDVIFFSKTTRPNLEATQPAIWWVPATFTGAKAAGAWNWPLIAF